MQVVYGIAIGVGVTILVGIGRWLFRRYSLKSKTDEEVAALKERVEALETQNVALEEYRALVMGLKESVDRWHEAMPPVMKSVFALLLKAQDGKVNGEIDDALKDVKKYLGI